MSAWAASVVAETTELTDSQISPGLPGFLAVFVLAIGTWFLVRSLTRRLRTVRYSDHETEQETPPPAE